MMGPGEKLVLVIPALLLTPVIAVAAVMPGVFNSELKLRAKPQHEGSTTIYQVRLIARLPVVLFGLVLCANLALDLHGPVRWTVLALLEAALLAMFARLPQRIVLDDEGIHSHRFLYRSLTIRWSDLQDVRTRRTNWDLFSDSGYRFRGTAGASILIDESGFEIEDILRRVRLRQPCPEISTVC